MEKSLTFVDLGGGTAQIGPSSATQPQLWVGLINNLTTRRMLVNVQMAKLLRDYLTTWIEQNED